MKPEVKTKSFTISMILFYFFSTSLLNWFNGTAFKDFGVYLIIFLLGFICLINIFHIIHSPHYVLSKESKAPFYLLDTAVVFFIVMVFNLHSLSDLLEAIYLFLFFTSMAYFIYDYLNRGIVNPLAFNKLPNDSLKDIRNSVIIDDYTNEIINRPAVTWNETECLRHKLYEARLLFEKDSKEWKDLNQAYGLTDALIKEKIQTPTKIINQMSSLIDSYIYLSTVSYPTDQIKKTLDKVEESFPVIVDGLTHIYNNGISQNLRQIEIDSESLKNILGVSGLGNDSFKIIH